MSAMLLPAMIIREATRVQLAEIYNRVSPNPVEKFGDTAVAARRVTRALAAARCTVVRAEDGTIVVVSSDDRVGKPIANQTITVLRETSPRTPGTKSAHRWTLYRTGMTVDEYVRLVMALGDKRRKAMRDVHWDALHGHISLT